MKIEAKTYPAPECRVLQAAFSTAVLDGSALSTTESITIDGEEFEW